MTFIPRHQEKYCFVACSEDKVNSGLCDCINRMRNEALHQPFVIGSVCTCTNFRKTPMINGKHICSICNKPIMDEYANQFRQPVTELNERNSVDEGKKSFCTCLSRRAIPMGTYFKCAYCGEEIENAK